MKLKAFFALTALSIFASLSASAELPNIILLMGDDHGWEETGYNGHPYVKTPVLDEMAATGLHLENFYAAHPSCSPTRASFMTGRHPNRMGTFSPGWSVRPEEITSAHILAKAGYRSAHFGKWHIGTVKTGSPVNPGAMGFDEWLSHDNFFELNASFSSNGGPPRVYPGESSEVLIRELINFIARVKGSGQPIFSVVWFGSPHEPYSGLPDDLALYDALPAKYSEKRVRLTSNETGERTERPQGDVLRERYAEITAMDRSIGTLRSYLEDAGLRENTLLFYCGDNGTSSDGSLITPHRGVKGMVYDGGILVPGVIEWPARIPKPRRTSIRTSTSDLLPTICGIAGQPLPDRPIDGIDLTPLIDGKMAERSNPLYFWQFRNAPDEASGAVPYIDPKLQVGTTPLVKKMRGLLTRNFTNFHYPKVLDTDYVGPRAVIDGSMKLVVHEDRNGAVKEELFDLKRDPEETRNLLKRDPETAERLRVVLRNWQESVLNSLTGADY